MEAGFYSFLDRASINSKEKGKITLGDNLYWGQRQFITTVFDALENDIHNIYILKSRQLGLTTISRALTAYYIGMHPGMHGALVFDTQPHKDSARLELANLISNIDPKMKFPKILGQGGRGNRDSLELVNESRMLFMSAGVRQSKSSGTLGRSEGLTMAHCSELCSWDNPEGLKSFRQSLSEFHPDRLYIYESTARGFNIWHDLWGSACEDELHCKTLFLGWWAREDQQIPRSSVDFEVYGAAPPSQKERERMEQVKELYDVEITPEQLAWIRRKVDPNARPDGDTDAGFDTEDNVMLAEQAWTADEAFQQTGSQFFGAKALTDVTKKYVSHKFKAYMFWCGMEFPPRIYHAENMKMTELKVWEEPDPDGIYVMGIDPAYGENENNDRSAIQICRCYADGMDQVAEYAWPMVTTYQLAWVIASLLGWYGQGRAEIRYILELNGPGTAVFNELKNLRGKIDAMRASTEVAEKGIADVFKNVRTYIYQRPDSMGAGYNYHWVTSIGRKVTIMERLRDFISNGRLHVRSAALIEEMKAVSREGDTIKAPDSMKDDRTLALALACYYWETKMMMGMIAQKRTRDAEEARRRMSIVDQVSLFNQNHLEDYFRGKQRVRTNLYHQQLRNQYRFGGRR
jgi:hypothetical protein